MANKSESERLYVLETKIDSIKEQLNKSDKKLDAFILASEKRWAERRELEELKDKTALKDKEYEDRIRLIEKMLYTGIGGLAIIQLYITYFVL